MTHHADHLLNRPPASFCHYSNSCESLDWRTVLLEYFRNAQTRKHCVSNRVSLEFVVDSKVETYSCS